MTVQNQGQQGVSQAKDGQSDSPLTPHAKKEFVEPEISEPVDVLEATTFFQGLDSGATN